MRIGGQSSVYQAQSTAAPQSADRSEYQVRVLKKALDSQQEAATKLLKMLEPKGKNLDIKA